VGFIPSHSLGRQLPHDAGVSAGNNTVGAVMAVGAPTNGIRGDMFVGKKKLRHGSKRLQTLVVTETPWFWADYLVLLLPDNNNINRHDRHGGLHW
jgi:hypothetical protein